MLSSFDSIPLQYHIVKESVTNNAALPFKATMRFDQTTTRVTDTTTATTIIWTPVTQASPENNINTAALIAVVSVSGLIIILGLIKHILHRVHRPEGNIFNGYVVDIELVTHMDNSGEEFLNVPGGPGEVGVGSIYNTQLKHQDQPPSYDIIEMELPSYEEIVIAQQKVDKENMDHNHNNELVVK